MSIEWFAIWIGQVVMVAGGMAIAVFLLSIALGYVWRTLGYARNFQDVREAVDEWKARHPEKFARWKRRNGIE